MTTHSLPSTATRERRLLVLAQRGPDQLPSQRFRHEQWAPILARDHGIALEFSAFESPVLTALMHTPGHRARKLALMVRDSWRRWSRRGEAQQYDGVVVLRDSSLVGPPLIERYLSREGIPLLYDFDDAVWLRRPDGASGFSWLARMPWKTAESCRLATVVTAGNEHLAAYARRFNQRVHLVRTSVDVHRFAPGPHASQRDRFRVVWSGSGSTLQYLDQIRPALEALATRTPMTLSVMCELEPRPFTNVHVEYTRWSPAAEVPALRDADVGIMPLPDTPTTRGKCGLKALQYMAVALPVVISPVGVNQTIVDDGENGLFAITQDDWVRQLQRLARDAGLRRRLGDAGRRTTEARFSAERSAADFAAAVDAALVEKSARGVTVHA